MTIAAINGYALGGGLELALACDLRICADDAKLGLPEILLGVIPGGGGTQRLARLVGVGRAKGAVLTGRQVRAEEALAIGLVNRVVPKADLIDEVLRFAATLAAGPRLAQAPAKAAIDEGWRRRWRTAWPSRRRSSSRSAGPRTPSGASARSRARARQGDVRRPVTPSR